MKKDLQKALDNVEMTYGELIAIATSIVDPIFADINSTINSIENSQLYASSTDSVRDVLLKLALKSFSLSEIKDKASLKQECAETLRKEAYAKSFNGTDGTVAFKENSALISVAEEILVESIYSLVSSMLKTKVDELHRVCDALKTILMSKMQEAKLSTVI
jgi:hypothetical protein